MRYVLPVLFAFAVSAIPAGISAQSREPLAEGCTRQRARAPRPDRRRPEEVQRDSLSAMIRDTLRAGIVEAARKAGVEEPQGALVIEIQDRQTGAALIAMESNVSGDVVQGAVDRAAPLLARWPERSGMTTSAFRSTWIPCRGKRSRGPSTSNAGPCP